MRRLRGSDAQHLYMENKRDHRHTMKIVVAEMDDPETFDPGAVGDELLRMLPNLPPLTWRLAPPAVPVGHPVFWHDPDIDLDDHVHHRVLDEPGDDRALCALISEIASSPLPRDTHLWQLVVATGLEHGRVAFIMKLHHSIADGGSAVRMILDTATSDPGDHIDLEVAGGVDRIAPEQEPPASRMLVDAAAHSVRIGLAVPTLLARTGISWARGTQRRLSGAPSPAAAFTGPTMPFNTGLTPRRTFVFKELPLAQLKHAKEVSGGTLNDVVLAVCATALRRHAELTDGEAPDHAMSTVIPVSIRKESEIRDYGNRLANIFSSLATDIADPVERFRAIQASAQAAKDNHAARDQYLYEDWFDAYPIIRAFIGTAQKAGNTALKRPTYNSIISNVRGPSEPLHHGPLRYVSIHSSGPLAMDIGLNITAWSYDDKMSFGILACPEHIPDLWGLADLLPPSLDDVIAAFTE